ncbi:MAG: hypothetical protein SFH39_05935 [Candidatus Magnetobacterium sp. LHC-1]|uniref:Uncharacterized protein n=1 Tax=Candidatus Magnetobacterium casense TaxID=1455061 RepID=A0ABS6S2L1_9BACT|nr:hypothetical protein [Candidatus Magnetobacterium casensis]MBF0607307.1 hypothetical protein [Nitrospirota bacterium]MBV6342877.1 hypothetical protein [Candidatus Magnetobacterium casensis]
MDTPTGHYDKIIKELLRDIERPLLEKVLGIKADDISSLNVVTQLTDERETDFVAGINEDGRMAFIVHAEFQSTNDSKMPKRMLRYFVHIYSVYEVVVKQYVIFIGKDKMKMESELNLPDICYRYNLIDIRNTPCERFLYSGVPPEIVFSVLCDKGNRDDRSFARDILTELIKSTTGELNLSMYMKELEVFSKLRDLQEIMIEEEKNMSIVYDFKTDIRFMQGRAEGHEEGQIKGQIKGMQSSIEILLKIKFGTKGLSLLDKVRQCEDESRLSAITEALIRADDFSAIEGLI